MKIVGTGFLSQEGVAQAEQLRERLALVLSLVERAVQMCHVGMAVAMVEGQKTPQEKQRIIACVVLARLLEISESIVLLARGGFSVDVISGTRNFLDAFFIFGNVCKDPTFVPEYFNTDLKMRQKLINQAMKYKDAPFTLMNEYATDEVKVQLKKQIADVAATELKTFEYATNVGAAHIYDSLYRIASSASHSAPRALSGYVVESPEGEILEVRRHPQMGDIPVRLHDVGALLLNVREEFDELFGRPTAPEVGRLRAEFESVVLPE